MSKSTRENVKQWAASNGCILEAGRESDIYRSCRVELLSPQGKQFEDGLMSLLCIADNAEEAYSDMWERLNYGEFELEDNLGDERETADDYAAYSCPSDTTLHRWEPQGVQHG